MIINHRMGDYHLLVERLGKSTSQCGASSNWTPISASICDSYIAHLRINNEGVYDEHFTAREKCTSSAREI
jgi:hypothetical protein